MTRKDRIRVIQSFNGIILEIKLNSNHYIATKFTKNNSCFFSYLVVIDELGDYKSYKRK